MTASDKQLDKYGVIARLIELIEDFPVSLESKLMIGGRTAFVPYSVQLGSFTKWSNAKRLYDELRANGFEANIHTAIVGDARFYRVRVGQYNTPGEAEEMARKLRNKGYTVRIYP